jgi:hypothetical protein
MASVSLVLYDRVDHAILQTLLLASCGLPSAAQTEGLGVNVQPIRAKIKSL